MNRLWRLKNFASYMAPQSTNLMKTKPIIYSENNKIVCDLQLLEEPNSHIESLVIVNNILNQEWLRKGLKCCDNIVLADGGANRFYETPFRDNPKVRTVVGDFDSLKPHVRSFYESRGVEFEKIWNQDTNDFQKAVKKSINLGWKKIFCFGAFGGRMDHTLGSMHHTTRLCKQHEDLQIVLFGQTNLMYLIRPNVPHVIKVSDKINKVGCGLIPFGKASKVKTKGFHWNIGPEYDYSSLEWGEFISTSNQIEGDTVEIESSDPLFFVTHF